MPDDMDGLSIGCVSAEPTPGHFVMADVVITRDGRLVARPGLRMM